MGARQREAALDELKLERIAENYAAPEFFITRIGYIDKMGPCCMRLWCCDEQPGTNMLEVKAKVIFPIVSFLKVRPLITAWGLHTGVFGTDGFPYRLM